MDPISIAVGAVVFGVGATMGRIGKPKPATPKVVCSCGHGYGTHENADACHAEVYRTSPYQNWVPCPCRSYDGPEPLPRSWVPPELT